MIYWTTSPILRMIPCYMMIGSTNTEQQSITKACLEWVDHFLPVPRWLISSTKVSRLMTTDLKAINYIIFNAYDYQKPELIAFTFRQMFGSGVYSQWIFFWLMIILNKGLLSVEGDAHKHQVRLFLNNILDIFSNPTVAEDFGQFYCVTIIWLVSYDL